MGHYHKKGYSVMAFFLKRGTRVHKRGTWYYQYALMSPFRDQLKCLVWEAPLCFPPSLLQCRPLVFIFALSCDRRAVLAFSVSLPIALGSCWAFTSCTVVLVPLLAFILFHVLHKFLPSCACRSICRILVIQTTPMTELH